MTLPERGLPDDQVWTLLHAAGVRDLPWREGRGWSLVYDSPPRHAELVAAAGAAFEEVNALSHSAFPSVAYFESAVLAMVSSLLCPDTPSYGVFTSGGTESIVLALKAYRDVSDRTRTEVLVPRTAHPAFGKAAQLLGLETRLIPVGKDGRVDPTDIRAAMGPHTLVVTASAPNFPFGVVDPIREVAEVAAHRGVGVHVDAALGGLFLPFVDSWDSPFGLDVPGVTSVSVDLHKYGYAPKGASTLMFHSPQLRHAAYFVDPDWPGGAYASASLAGTRSGRAAAGAYASLMSLGRAGLSDLVVQVMGTTKLLIERLRDCDLYPVALPDMSVFAVTSHGVDLDALAWGLHERGWWMDVQRHPTALHFVVMPRHERIARQFLSDVSFVLADPPTTKRDGETGAYGVMVRGVGSGSDARDLLRQHLDWRYGPSP